MCAGIRRIGKAYNFLFYFFLSKIFCFFKDFIPVLVAVAGLEQVCFVLRVC